MHPIIESRAGGGGGETDIKEKSVVDGGRIKPQLGGS